ncbi:MAG: L,D-transpeptidase [Pseudomonadota bacterium]|nr:L,D-transpeptidase [Pseudomonadota bacterium]
MRYVCIAIIFCSSAFAETPPYGVGLCDDPDYQCIKVKRGQSWQKLFPDENERAIVQRVNRSDTYLWAGKKIAVPKNLSETTLFDISPFALKIPSENEKLIIIDQDKLAWAAYDPEGTLVNWGPMSSGQDFCSDEQRACRSITGIYRVFEKKDKDCYSTIFPIEKGGSPMPYCMYYYKGSAMHGSHEVVGHRASHGCIRMFVDDARWLNQEFVEPTDKETGLLGTKVVIQPLTEPEEPTDEE